MCGVSFSWIQCNPQLHLWSLIQNNNNNKNHTSNNPFSYWDSCQMSDGKKFSYLDAISQFPIDFVRLIWDLNSPNYKEAIQASHTFESNILQIEGLFQGVKSLFGEFIMDHLQRFTAKALINYLVSEITNLAKLIEKQPAQLKIIKKTL